MDRWDLLLFQTVKLPWIRGFSGFFSSRMKGIFLKALNLKDKQITGIAYCDGKSGVTLGLTTTETTCSKNLVKLNTKIGEKWSVVLMHQYRHTRRILSAFQ